MLVVIALLIVLLALGAAVTGYVVAVLTDLPMQRALQERQRIAQERRLAELRLQHITHVAMQQMLGSTRFDREP